MARKKKFYNSDFFSDPVTLIKKLKNLSLQELKELTFIMYKAANNQRSENFDALTDEEKEKEVMRYCMCEIPESTQKKAMAKFLIGYVNTEGNQ